MEHLSTSNLLFQYFQSIRIFSHLLSYLAILFRVYEEVGVFVDFLSCLLLDSLVPASLGESYLIYHFVLYAFYFFIMVVGGGGGTSLVGVKPSFTFSPSIGLVGGDGGVGIGGVLTSVKIVFAIMSL